MPSLLILDTNTFRSLSHSRWGNSIKSYRKPCLRRIHSMDQDYAEACRHLFYP
jgi:hypothetical protein